ncbi:MAG TPA: zinc ribbon domain-containing protein [Candidatus Dormibacteraeota bacterium]|nr:zinc ribbon domain-containing protein [Candidatus Dormibacteraeota bacterium]
MADLFDILGGALDIALDMQRGRRERDPYLDEPPLPPGIPALPPDPRAIARGLDAIRAHDPAFDEAAFLAHAHAVWNKVTTTGAGAGLPALRDEAISAVSVGPEIETITVRFGTAAGEQDWVFRRAATAVTDRDPATTANHCPNCGAPLQLDPKGACPYCHTSVLAALGWALTTQNLLRPMTARDAAVLAMVAQATTPAAPSAPPPPPPAASTGVDLAALGVDAYSLLATARDLVYAVAQARSQRRPDMVASRVDGDLAAALAAEAADMTARHRHHILAFLEVTDAVITATDHAADGDRVTVRMRMNGQEYGLADGGMALVDGTQTQRTWSEDWVLRRAAAGADWVAISTVRVADGGAS